MQKEMDNKAKAEMNAEVRKIYDMPEVFTNFGLLLCGSLMWYLF